jgi:ComEC/Rec2-related protein
MMVMWWAVFFVSGCTTSPCSITFLFFVILLMLCLRFTEREGRRFVFFLLCASTSMVIWTASLQPEGKGSRGPLTGGVPKFVAELRGDVIDSLDDPNLSERSGDLLAALLFGSRDRLERKLRDSYSHLGIAHFLALSGLHLGILMIPLVWGLSFFPFGKTARSICTLVLIICYSFLAGLPPSLLRATALAALFMIQRSMGRKTTLARSLLLAVFMILLIDERILHSGGFQLSCTAVLAIALIGLPVIRAIRTRIHGRLVARIATFFLGPAVITISVNILTLPLLLSFFGRAPLLAPVYNLLMFIPVTIMLYLGLIYAALPIGPVRALAAPPINLIADFLCDVPIRLSSNPQPAILAGSVCYPIYIAGTALFAAALRMGGKRRIICVCAASILLAASFLVNGDRCIKTETIGEHAVNEPYQLTQHTLLFSDRMLVIDEDIGRWEAETAVRALWKMGIGRIGSLVVCPSRLGWRGGVEHIVSRIDFTEVICSPYLARHDGGLMDILRSRRIERRIIERSDSLEVYGWKIWIVAPTYPPPEGGTVPMEQACIRVDYHPSGGVPKIEN